MGWNPVFLVQIWLGGFPSMSARQNEKKAKGKREKG